jgi:WD40 repeat protein
VATTGSKGSLKIWEVPSGRKLLELKVPKPPIACFSPSGGIIAVGGSAEEGAGTVIVYDSQTGRIMHTLNGHSDTITCLAFSPDEMRLASGDALGGAGIRKPATIKLWELRTGQELLELAGNEEQSSKVYFQSLVFARDGKWLAESGLRTVRIWEATDREGAR